MCLWPFTANSKFLGLGAVSVRTALIAGMICGSYQVWSAVHHHRHSSGQSYEVSRFARLFKSNAPEAAMKLARFAGLSLLAALAALLFAGRVRITAAPPASSFV